MRESFILPSNHDLIYQDNELVITISDQYPADPEETFAADHIRGCVYFWTYDDGDEEEINPVMWDDSQDKTIIIQRAENPTESASCIHVLTSWNEEQYFYVSAKVGQFLAKRFNRTLKVAKGYPLQDNQEILHEDDNFVVVLTKREIGIEPNITITQIVHFSPKDGVESEDLIWDDNEDENITTNTEQGGEVGYITVFSLNTEKKKISIPLGIAKILATRFRKQIVSSNFRQGVKKVSVNQQIQHPDQPKIIEDIPNPYFIDELTDGNPHSCKVERSAIIAKSSMYKTIIGNLFVLFIISGFIFIDEKLNIFILLIVILALVSVMREMTRLRCISLMAKNPTSSRKRLFFLGYCVASLISVALFLISSVLASKVFEFSSSYATNFILIASAFSWPFAITIPFKTFKDIDTLTPRTKNRSALRKFVYILIAILLIVLALPALLIRCNDVFSNGISRKNKTPKYNQHEHGIDDLKEFQNSVINDRQKQLNAINSGIDIEVEPLKERLEKISQIAGSSDGYVGLLMKSWVEGMNEINVLGQEYQKASSEAIQPSEHDLHHLYKCKESLIRCKILMQKMNKFFANYRDFLERVIPQIPKTISFKDFDQNEYTSARNGFINGTLKNLSPAKLVYYQTEEEIWDIKIEEADFLIERFKEWEIDSDGTILFEKQSDLDRLNALQKKLENAAKRSREHAQKMLDEDRERLNSNSN